MKRPSARSRSKGSAGRETVLVTGGGSGIGLALARILRDRGTRVCVVDRQARGPAVALAAASGGRIFERDVRDFAAAAGVVGTIVEAYGRLEGLVNCAGISKDRVCWEMSEADWDDVIAVDLKGAFNYARAAAPHMRRQRRGRIVNVASTNALRGKWGLANYSAAKAGMIGMTRVFARELGKYNVTVNAVAPGMVRTPLTAGLPPEIMQRASKEAALGRIAEPRDIAAVIAFLLTDDARHVTGAVVPVDGGQTA